jgi:hypothetical protein
MSTALSQRSMSEKIESKINIDVARGIKLSPGRGLEISSLEDAFEVSKVLAIAGTAVPKHLRDKPGLCLNVCLMAYALNIDPFALANKTYEVNDRLCYESALYHAVVLQRAPITGRIKASYDGEGPKRTCKVWATLKDDGDTVEYVSPPTGSIKPKNSPLWTNDPDQQLFYFSVRSFARRHFPDVMMGIFTVDEMQDAVEIVRTVESRPKVERLASQLLGDPPAIEQQPEAAHEPDPYFVPHDTDDRKQAEPAKTKRESPPAAESHPEPPTAAAFMVRIENALNKTALNAIASEADRAKSDGFIDQAELDQLAVMIQETGKRI